MTTATVIAPVDYQVVSFDADSTVTELSTGLTKLGREGWTLVNSYHLHHLNAVFYVLSKPSDTATA